MSGMKVRNLVVLCIRPVRRTYAVVVSWIDELLWGKYKWVSRFERPCIPTRWAGVQSSRHGTAWWRQCDSTATKLSRLDGCEGWKVVRWCRSQVSSHTSQGVGDGGVNEAGMSTAAPDRSALLCCWMDHGWVVLCNVVALAPQPQPASRLKSATRNVNFFAKWLRVSAIRERPVKRYSEVFGFGAESQGFVVVFDFRLTISFLVVEMEDCVHRCSRSELSLHVWRYSLMVAIPLLSTPSTTCQSPSACMIARSSAYVYFLETVVGKSEM